MTEPSRGQAFAARSVPENYDRYLAPYMFEPWARLLLDEVPPPVAGSVLDVATGTGVVARAAARRVGSSGRVVASDISPAMVDYVAGRPAQPAAAPIESLVASASDLQLPNSVFDVVYCQQGMPFIPDRSAAVREMRRVLKSGGRVGIVTWAGRRVEPFATLTDVLADAGMPEPFPGAFDTDSYVLTDADLKDMLDGAGFGRAAVQTCELTVSWPDLSTFASLVHGTPFGPLLARLPSDQQDRLVAALTDGLSRFRRGDGFSLDTVAYVATGEA